MSVIGDLNICLEIPETDISRRYKGGKGVLRKTLESSTMCESDKGVVGVRIEKRVMVPKLHEEIQMIVERRWNAVP
jgi:hypothetical protein